MNSTELLYLIIVLAVALFGFYLKHSEKQVEKEQLSMKENLKNCSDGRLC